MPDAFSPDLNQIAAAANQPTMPTLPNNPADPRYSMLARILSAGNQAILQPALSDLAVFGDVARGQTSMSDPATQARLMGAAQLATGGMGQRMGYDIGPAGFGRDIGATPGPYQEVVNQPTMPVGANQNWGAIRGNSEAIRGPISQDLPEVGSPMWNVRTGSRIYERASDFPPYQTIGGGYANLEQKELLGKYTTENLLNLHQRLRNEFQSQTYALKQLQQIASGDLPPANYQMALIKQNPQKYIDRSTAMIHSYHRSLAGIEAELKARGHAIPQSPDE